MGSEMFSRPHHRRSNRHAIQAIQPTRFVHNPYSLLQSFEVVSNGPASKATLEREVAKKVLPAGTLRLDLCGQVPFFAFPDQISDRTRQRSEAPPLSERPDSLVQLFFGQLPYKVSDSLIVWLADQFAESNVLYIERVMQDKSRKGCMQVFVDEEDADFIITALNKRVLYDATGVWQAQNDEQVKALEEHCRLDAHRYKGFPFRPMVVERSTSTYVRRHRAPAAAATATTTTAPTPSSHRSNASATPPPQHCSATDLDSMYHHDVATFESPAPEDDFESSFYEPAYIPCEGPYRSYVPAPAYDEYVYGYPTATCEGYGCDGCCEAW